VKIGFQTAQVTNGKEQDFADFLRSSEGFISELSLVAEEDGNLVGQIMLTKTYIEDGSDRHEVLLLGPLTVALEHRNKGIASKLIEEGLLLARQKGYASVILVGNPVFYRRFGFKTSESFGVTNTNGIPGEYVLACELKPEAFKGVKGSITFVTDV